MSGGNRLMLKASAGETVAVFPAAWKLVSTTIDPTKSP